MKTLIKLVIAALVVHASWRAGTAYWKYYKFRDNVQHTAQFAADQSESDVRARVLELASELAIPVAAEQVSVRREKNYTFIDAAYTDQIEILPRYFYPWDFTLNVQAFTVRMPAAQDLIPGGTQ